MGKTDGEEDPDGLGWSKPIGKKRRGKKNADDFASLLPSSTCTGKAYPANAPTSRKKTIRKWIG